MAPGFDPNAAAAAYLRMDPARLLAARAHTLDIHWAGAAGGALAILVCWLILQVGVLAHIKAAIERARPRPWLASAACAAVFVVLFAVLMLPWDALIAWRQAQPGPDFDLPTYLQETLRDEVAPLVVVTVLITLLYALARRAPRTWSAMAGVGAALLVALGVWLPYALDSGPAGLPAAPPGPIRDGLIRLIHDAGLPAREVYLGPGGGLDANVTGTPFGARVVISQGMLDKASPAEVRAGVGHLAGHFHYGDELSMGVLLGLMTLAGLVAAHRLFVPASRLMRADGLSGAADPSGLPVLAAIGLVWLAGAGVAFNTFDRLVNVRADQYSLDHAREPDGLAQSLTRDWRGDDIDPPAWEEALFYDHPPLRSRVLHAMRWKAANGSPS